MNKNCSIFFYDGYVGIAPTIINFSKFFASQGYSVTIFATQNNVPQPKNLGSKVEILYFKKKFKIIDYFSRSKLSYFSKFVEISIFTFQSFSHILKCLNYQDKPKLTTNVVVDFHGLMLGFLCYWLLKQKFIFLSLEIQEIKNNYIYNFIIKIIGNLVYKKSELVIVQDADRLQNLTNFYQYKHPQVFYLPNCPAKGIHPDTNEKNFFREKLKLCQVQFPHLILQAGMINDFTSSRSLAQAFASINSGCALIFHDVSTTSTQEDELYKHSLVKINPDNLFLSLNPVPYDQVDKVYASATIGLALYATDQGDNFTKIAKASGKLAYFLKHGKPTLVSNFPSLVELNEKYQFGVVIDDAANSQEIQAALEKILNSYETYSRNAKICFDAEFDFEQKMQPILASMEF
jgi:glycosyltransferase involved in cell wall biosynthesis